MLDVVLMDIAMPGRDGWEVAKLLLEQAHPKKPFIVTGRQSEEDHSEVGIKLHPLKPIDQKKLGSVLREFSTTLSLGVSPHLAVAKGVRKTRKRKAIHFRALPGTGPMGYCVSGKTFNPSGAYGTF